MLNIIPHSARLHTKVGAPYLRIYLPFIIWGQLLDFLIPFLTFFLH
uniref:Uncharacterized protein n=1 Tax=Arundo donax TaxID=35708 RepID=A0A0A9SB65_ARUDO